MKAVPSKEWCTERLIQLLERVNGDRMHPTLIGFWQERSRAMDQGSDEEITFATELFWRLEGVWNELTTAPGEEFDVFGSFGI